MPLLERSTFLASLLQDADEARHGEGRLVLLSGEAGVGKTALPADRTGEPDWIALARPARTEAAWLTERLPAAAGDEPARGAEVADRCDPWVRGAVAAWRRRLGRPGGTSAGLPDPRADRAGDARGARRLRRAGRARAGPADAAPDAPPRPDRRAGRRAAGGDPVAPAGARPAEQEVLALVPDEIHQVREGA